MIVSATGSRYDPMSVGAESPPPFGHHSSEVSSKMLGFEPADPLVGRPELAGLVDVDLACLLAVRLAKLLADAQRLEPGHEDPSLAAEVGGTRQP